MPVFDSIGTSEQERKLASKMALIAVVSGDWMVRCMGSGQEAACLREKPPTQPRQWALAYLFTHENPMCKTNKKYFEPKTFSGPPFSR